ncbi:hypothetical protein tloyanaT_12990 [Thalassotalea loyana]|uniref:Tip attachment protein J domain-containing protein n=1 Tax=Thalassotalea loyana TaxID=280483 RepID=A0ABQ6HA94_9GAMM|nr:phage tail protein [Thalassotalea loyana]GLX85047.1 hypothetical protein tloyanaT_12990 [Thalassotalea loyana]
MPPVVVAVAAGVAAGVAAASVVVGIAAGVAAVALTAALKPDLGSASESLNQAQSLGTGTMQPRRDIYGETLVGGAIVGYGSYEDDDENLHHVMVIPIAAHACQSVNVYDIEGQVLADDPILASKVDLRVKLGDQVAACDVALRYCDGWTEDHIGNGITYVTVDIVADPDYFTNGVNSIRFKVKGKSVYDPRKDSTNGGIGSHRANDESTWEWSENPILCAMDFIRFGGYKEQPISRFDIADISAQANACDETVNYTDDNDAANTEKRFTCNGTLAKDQSPSENLKRLLSSMGAKPYNYSGKIYLKAGVYQGAPTMTIDKTMAAGIISYQPHTPIKDRVNLVRTSFVDPKRYYQATDATPTSNDTYKTQDGMTLEQELRLFCTNSETMCQRLGKGFLEQNREGFTINFPLNASGLLLEPGTNYLINLPEDGLNNVEFRCESVQWDPRKKIVNTVFKKDSSELYPDDFEPNERKRSGNNFISDSFAMPSWSLEDIIYTESTDENRNEQGILSWYYPLQGVSYDVQIQQLNPEFISHTDDRFNPKSPSYNAELKFLPQYLTVRTYSTQDRVVAVNGLQIGSYRARLTAKNRSGRQKEIIFTLVIANEPINSPIRYTWRKYKKRIEQPFMTDDPTDALYEGIAENQLSPIESNDPTDYIWRKIGFDVTKERTPIAMYYYETDLTAWSDTEALAGLREALEDANAQPIHGDRIVLVNSEQSYSEGKWYHEDGGWTGFVWKVPKGRRAYLPKPIITIGNLTNLNPILNEQLILNSDGTLAGKDENGNSVNLGGVNRTGLGLGNVENKSSATIRGEIGLSDLVGGGRPFGTKPNKFTWVNDNTLGRLSYKLDDGTTQTVQAITQDQVDGRADSRVSALRPDSTYKNTEVQKYFNAMAASPGAMFFNRDFSILAEDGRPAGCFAAYGSASPGNVVYNSTENALQLFNGSDSSIGVAFSAFRVNPKTKYSIRIKVKASVASATGFYFRMQELDSELPDGKLAISNGQAASESTVTEDTRQITSFRENDAISDTWQEFTFTYTPTATAKWASPVILNWTGLGLEKIYIKYLDITPLSGALALKDSLAKSDVGLGSVENKSSATIRGEIVEADIVGTGKTFATKPNKFELINDETLGQLSYKLDDGTTATYQAVTQSQIDGRADSRIGSLRPDSNYKNSNTTKANVGLGSVENKSSATIRGEITETNLKDAANWTETPASGATKNTGALADQDALSDQTQIPMVNSAGALVTISGLTITATTDWEGIASQISISAHTVRFGHGNVTYNQGTIWTTPNRTYYLYCDDPTYAGGAVTYVATQSKSDLTANTGRRYVGKIVTPPANGSGGGSGGGGLQP